MFICETINRTATSSDLDFFPNLSFFGAPKNCPTTLELINFIQSTISSDYTAESVFLGEFDKWCKQRIEQGRINVIDGIEIGTKTIEGKQVVIDDLLANHYLNLCPDTYGVLIPADEILKRHKFEWFARLSEKQVLQSDTIIGNYILVAVAPGEPGVLEPLEPSMNREVESHFVGFWRTPLQAPVWSLKPNYLGNNMQMLSYPGR